ncbi:MAG: hypothetical protein ACFHU9_05975 [Fluviicola sp.]
MITKNFLLFIALTCFSFFSFSQNDANFDFEKDIVDKGWSVEDTTQKAEHEMMILLIEKDSLYLGYINWIEGMASSVCAYNYEALENCVELTATNCSEGSSLRYLYLYLSEDKLTLHLLFEDEKLTDTSAIRKKKGWIRFEQFTE